MRTAGHRRQPIRNHIVRARRYISAEGVGPLFVRSVAGSGAVRVVSMIASFGVGVQLARGLGVEGYGYYGLALSVVTIAGIPGEMGLSRLVMREVATASARDDTPRLFGVLRWADKVCWLLSAIFAVAAAIAGVVLINTGSEVLGISILLGIPIIPFLALARIRGGALQGLHFITLGQVPANLLRPLLLSLFLFGALAVGMMTPATAMALSSLTAAMVFLIAHVWLAGRLPAAQPPAVTTEGRKWLGSAIPLALTDGMRMLQLELTTLLLGLMAAAAEVGLFRIAVVTATMLATPMVILNRASMPMIARLHAMGERVQLQKVVTYSAYLQFGGVLVLTLPLLLFPEQLLSLVFGKSFAAGGDALRLIAIGQIANAAFGPNVPLLNMTHHERRVTRAMMIALVLNAVTVLALAPAFGTVGAAWGFVVSLLSWNLLTWFDARRRLGIETSIIRYWKASSLQGSSE